MFIPIALTIAAVFAAFATYRGIRRGGARFYTLEREAILRRAMFTLTGSVLLFLGAIGFLLLQMQPEGGETTAESGDVMEDPDSATSAPIIERIPPTPSATPTQDASLPTATPTPIICRAVVEGTFGNGLTLRESPGGAELAILPETTLITLIADEEPQFVDNNTWRKVSSVVNNQEGWVAEQFLAIEPGCE